MLDSAFRRTRRNRLHWAIVAFALTAELALMVLLWDGQIYGWEQSLTSDLQDVPGKRLIFDVSSTLTNTLSVPFLAIFLAIVVALLLLDQREAVVLLALSVPLHVLAEFPKVLVDRPRPSPVFEGIEGMGGPRSFPSGHSEYVVTFYGFLAYLVILHVKGRWARAAIVVAWVTLALATGFGRIAGGRHWPVDVLAGYVIGLGLLSVLIWLHSALRSTRDRAVPRGHGSGQAQPPRVP